MYLLDTNACIRFLNGTSEALVEQVEKQRSVDIALCSVVKAELAFGAEKSSRRRENLETLRDFFAPFVSFPFDDNAAEHLRAVRADLESRGEPIGPNDLMIASIARANGLVLITHNQDEFQRVSDLRLEDWES